LFSEKAKSSLLELCMKIKNSATLHLILTYEDGGINERSELIKKSHFQKLRKIKNCFSRALSFIAAPPWYQRAQRVNP